MSLPPSKGTRAGPPISTTPVRPAPPPPKAAKAAKAQKTAKGPAKPRLPVLRASDPKTKLVANVREAILSVPAYFDSRTFIEGLEVGDLFSLNSVLGGTIEVQVVDTLNKLRPVWDPQDEWSTYQWERFAQGFPDVRLVARPTSQQTVTALGIELKGWYLLAKEREPSFRYKVTPTCCAPHDLLVVVPWHLKNVLSGVPVVYEPFIAPAGYVAELRNWWWLNDREATDDTTIDTAPGASEGPYPPPRAKVNDAGRPDGGKNFGRVARIHVMDEYLTAMLTTRVAGVEADHWVSFFKYHIGATDPAGIRARIERDLGKPLETRADVDADRVRELLLELGDLLGDR